ncbi:MAG: PP0621 family protein [Candidatus Thiodiazotropha sp.]
MGLKTLLFGLAIWGIYLIARHFLRLKSTQSPPTQQYKSVDSVECDYCGLHLPRNEAITSKGLHYCSNEHLIAAETKKP